MADEFSTDDFLWDQHSLRQDALNLLSVADCVTKEGWSDAVAAQLRQAAHDLLGMVPGAPLNSVAKRRISAP